MSLHDEIMRLEMQEDRYALPYANGYSDARDDAAELACKTDAEIGPAAIASGKYNARRIVACVNACAAPGTAKGRRW